MIDNLHEVIWGNEIQTWAFAVAAFLVATFVLSFVFRLSSGFLTRRSQKTAAMWDDLVADVLGATRVWFLAILSLAAASTLLKLSQPTRHFIDKALVVALVIQIGYWGSALITFYFSKHFRRRAPQDAAGLATLGLIGILVKFVFYSVLTIVALHNVGINVTAFVAGLGVGGIAVALAVQNILGDLFASLSIVLDKPFAVGDFIAVGELAGSVEQVGLKTTRVRSLSGEQLVFSNADLLQSRIKNYKRMMERRVVLSLGVAYDTPPEKLKAVPGMIQEAISRHGAKVRFERSHFYNFGESTLDFETVYWILSPDYNLYMDIHQAVHLELLERFNREAIEIAYPTRTLLVKSEDLKVKLLAKEPLEGPQSRG